MIVYFEDDDHNRKNRSDFCIAETNFVQILPDNKVIYFYITNAIGNNIGYGYEIDDNFIKEYRSDIRKDKIINLLGLKQTYKHTFGKEDLINGK